MIQLIDFEEALKLPDPVFIDVRSESEYQEDHFPGAISIPVFNDEERKKIGTAYKNLGWEYAKRLGMSIAAPKLPDLVQAIEKAGNGKKIVIYCFRGGMRSQSVCTILDLMSINAYRLIGGYKGYRQYVNNYFNQNSYPFEIIVIHGLTGTGKTNVIQKVLSLGGSAVDLEGLANNRGSVFGNVGLYSQPTQKMFESQLWFELHKNREHKYIIMECESKRIGKITLPASLYSSMKAGRHILLFDSLNHRIERILHEYQVDLYKKELASALIKLKRRLGNETVLSLHNMIDSGDFFPVVEKLLVGYYDLLYKYPACPSHDYDFCVNSFDEDQTARRILNFLSTLK